MFENVIKKYLQVEPPTTVIPRCMPRSLAREIYGDPVYKICSNENPFGPSPKAVEAMQAAMAECNLYSDGSREKVLYAKLAAKHDVLPENIYFSAGAANVLKDLVEVFICEGDEVIVSKPSYPPYYNWIFKNSGVCVDVPCRAEDQKMDMEGLLAAVTDKTKMLLLTNPNNPTSTAVPRKAMLDLLDKLPETVIVIADEAYVDYADDPEGLTLAPFVAKYPNLVVVRTFSKIYGLAAVRLGYCISCKEINVYLNRAMAARDLNTFGTEGGIAAIDDEEHRQKTMKNNKVERDYVISEIRALGYKIYESQTNFVWVDFGRPAADVHDDLLPYGLIIRGDFNFARISIGLHHENEALINALKDVKAKKGV